MKLEDLQFGLKWVSIGMRLVIGAWVGIFVTAILSGIGKEFLIAMLVLLLLCAVVGALATILGVVNLRKVNWNYQMAFWALLVVVALSFKFSALQKFDWIRSILQYGMETVFAINLVQGTNKLLEQRGYDELVRWGRWAIRWAVAVAATTFLYVFFTDVVDRVEMQTICLVVGVIVGILFLIYYIGYLGDASKKIAAWESLPGENAPQQTDQP